MCVLVEALEKKQAERAQEQSGACDVEHEGNQVTESSEEADTAAAVNDEDSATEVNTTQNLVSSEALYPVCYPD